MRLVLARIIEPTSKADTIRMLEGNRRDEILAKLPPVAG